MPKITNTALKKYLELVKLSDELDETNNYQYSKELSNKYIQYLCNFKYNKLKLQEENIVFVEVNHSYDQLIIEFSNLAEFQEYVCNNFLELRKKAGWYWYFYIESLPNKFWAISYREDVFMYEMKSKSMD